MDGAGRWHSFRYVTWPGLRPTFVFVVVTITIAALGLFVQIDVMTQGGPLDSTTTIIFHAVQQGFRQQEVGYGAALSLIFFVLVLAVSLIQRRLTQEKQA
jgi:multiple sugar transport system permease protein/raffinose/stachyose/melibiose transport system permease protein